jgi:hypothetical protein
MRGTSIIEPIFCTPSHFTMDLLFIFFIIWFLNFFFVQLLLFCPNLIAIESNLLTMDKIKKQEIKVEKTPQMGNDFKIHTKSLT